MKGAFRGVPVSTVPAAEFTQAYIDATGPLDLRDRLSVALRGVPVPRAVYVSWPQDQRRIVAWDEAADLEGLLAHEFGHVLGHDHPRTDGVWNLLRWVAWSARRGFPTMGCWPRLRDPEGLRPQARDWLSPCPCKEA